MKLSPDIINGLFEFIGSLMLWRNVRQLYRDKQIKGVTWGTTTFFMMWGYWNMFFYPHLNQWFSFLGGCSITLANTVWVGQMVYYLWYYKREPVKNSRWH